MAWKLSSDEMSMVEACGFSIIDVIDIYRGHIAPELIHSGEHEELHHIPDGIDNYIDSIPPVIRVWDGYALLGNDGNHRVNTCLFYHKKCPATIIYVAE